MPPSAPTLRPCVRCSAPIPALAPCSWCGGGGAQARAALERPPPARAVAVEGEPLDGRWLVLGIGAVLAPVLTLTPLLRYVGWFLASLVHETGHAAVAWAFGCPAFPAIRIDGHAAAIHREQQPVLCALVLGVLLAFAWASRERPRRLAVAVALVVAYPLAAFTRVHESLFLLAGHLGELGFAAYAFTRAMDGGFSGSTAERVAHAAVGWYLVGRTGALAIGLLTSDATRSAYETNGSFGLENDLVRFAHDSLGTSSLAPGALLLLLLSLAVASLAVALASRLGHFVPGTK
jgi:hypothetical protein